MSDAYLVEAGWWFFAAWSVIVAVVSVAAFGRELLPSRESMKLSDGSAVGPKNQETSRH
jgi:hypothetical protein